MFVRSVSIGLDSGESPEELASALRAVTTEGPFVLVRVEQDGHRQRCVFDVERVDMVVGYRSVIDLQMRIHRLFDIVSVEQHPVHLARPHYEITERIA